MALLVRSADLPAVTDDDLEFRISALTHAISSLRPRSWDVDVRKALRDCTDTRALYRKELKRRALERNYVLPGFDELMNR